MSVTRFSIGDLENRIHEAGAKGCEKAGCLGLKSRSQTLLDLLSEAPFRHPPPFEWLVGGLKGAYSRRIDIPLDEIGQDTRLCSMRVISLNKER